jgi:hypothetical protein
VSLDIKQEHAEKDRNNKSLHSMDEALIFMAREYM